MAPQRVGDDGPGALHRNRVGPQAAQLATVLLGGDELSYALPVETQDPGRGST